MGATPKAIIISGIARRRCDVANTSQTESNASSAWNENPATRWTEILHINPGKPKLCILHLSGPSMSKVYHWLTSPQGDMRIRLHLAYIVSGLASYFRSLPVVR